MAGIFAKILAARDVINHAEALSDSAIWSNRSAVASAVAGLLGLVAVFAPDIQIPPDDAQAIAGGVAAVGGLLNAYLHVAGNPAAGIKRKR